MLQSFLQQMIPAMEQGVMLTVPLGILLAIIRSLKDKEHIGIFKKALKWGFFVSLFVAAAKTGTRQAVSREVFESMAIVLDILSTGVLLTILFRGHVWTPKVQRIFRIGVGGLTLGLFLYHGLEIWLMPVTAFQSGEGHYFTLEMLVKILGYLLGLMFGFLSGFLVYKAAAALRHRRLIFVFTVQLLATLFQQSIFFLQVLMARQLFGTLGLLPLMAPFIDYQSWVIFIIFVVTLLVPVTLFLQPKPLRPEWANPAEYRKLLAQAIHKRRWGKGLLAMLLMLIVFSSAGSWYANRKPELVPAVTVQAEAGFVEISLDQLEDGHLHRYAYRATDGTMIRVIIIKKGGASYGVGLDACEVCGPTGYYEKDGQVICKLCNVMMNKATIGMPGGCNPVPVEASIENGQVRISVDALEKEKIRFH